MSKPKIYFVCSLIEGIAVTSPVPPQELNASQPNCVTFAGSTKSGSIGIQDNASSSMSLTRKNVRMYSLDSANSDANSTPLFPRKPLFCGPSTSSIYAGVRPPMLSQDSGATSSQSDITHKYTIDSSNTTSFSRSGTLESSGRRKKLPMEKSYSIVKEMLCTERTYVKDLMIVTSKLRETVDVCGDETAKVLDNLFAALQPIVDVHTNLVTELHTRMTSWENRVGVSLDEDGSVKRVSDVLLCCVHNSLPLYHKYVGHMAVFVAAIDELRRTRRPFDLLLREFESRKVCYIPLNELLIRPAYRLYAWQQILCRLVAYFTEHSSAATAHPELAECRVSFDRISELIMKYKNTIDSVHNFCKMVELEKDLIGVDNLLQPNRVFLREGCLQRYSSKGPVQRVFLLFNDCLLYANRSGVTSNPHQHLQFKLHGQIPLRGLLLEDGDPFKVAKGMQHCFTIYGDNRSLILSCANETEKQMWLTELRSAVVKSKESSSDMPRFASLKSTCSVDEVDASSVTIATTLDTSHNSITPLTPEEGIPGERHIHQRANNTLHVGWHRCSTIGKEDIVRTAKQQLSGYLLRKFRNSSGWQRLWVVYCHFCLFFYKNHNEEAPLASLPLLGYRVGAPQAEDGVLKDNVFKLHYKTHYYLFRAESQYSYLRWLEVIDSVCSSISTSQTTEI